MKKTPNAKQNRAFPASSPKNKSAANASRQMGEVRIIAGLWRGKKLPVLTADGLRPTTDRVKETLFNWLMTDVAGSHCLDCFAGSGSLGFEALSRQAEAVIFLEKFADAAKLLQKNLQALKSDAGLVVQTDSLHYLNQTNPHSPFNLVFVDPPFQQGFVPPILALLQKNHWLAENALIYVETEQNHPPLILPTGWEIIKEKQAGQVVSRLIQT